jgi:hypothetical protein
MTFKKDNWGPGGKDLEIKQQKLELAYLVTTKTIVTITAITY